MHTFIISLYIFFILTFWRDYVILITNVFELVFFTTIVVLSLCVLVTRSCPTPFDPMDCSPPGFSVHVISQERILK